MGKKKIDWRRYSENCDSDISDAVTVIDVSKYSTLEVPHFLLIKNEEEVNKALSGMGFCSNCDPFPCLCNNGSDGLSNVEEGEFDQECQLVMAF